MLEPDDSEVSTIEVTVTPKEPESVSLLEDDTYSPPPITPDLTPELPASPAKGDSAVQKIRQTLESTGDLRPQAPKAPTETFMIPPANLEEAKLAVEDLDNLSDFDTPDDDSLDLDGEAESLDLGDGLLDDLEDE
ncbi:MAG: hypothetical protein LBU69_00780 [Deltaproteobacteria bacterium]|nr:hypothetical protein [Deltaproteobacteria bacterium]